MKKILSIVLAVMMCFTAALTLASCGHEHEYKADWSSDATHHWHACNDAECTEPADKAEHTWDAGTEKEFPNTEYACTVCGYKKTVAATTTVSDEQWTAAMDLGENYTINAEQVTTGQGREVSTDKRAGNLFSSESKSYAEGETEPARTYSSYGKIEGDKYYVYTPSFGVDDELLGYNYRESSQTPQEAIDENMEMCLPEILRDKTKYTHNTETGYYECAEISFEMYDMAYTVRNIKLGFKDGKLVSLAYTVEVRDMTMNFTASITYGGATVTLPTADQIIQN